MNTQQKQALSLDNTEGRRALWRGLARIQGRWDLSDLSLGEALHLHRTNLTRWRARGEVASRDKKEIEVLQNFFAIFRSLGAMFQSPADQKLWLTTTHPDFGCSPLTKMKENVAGLLFVRSYLDYVRGRGA